MERNRIARSRDELTQDEIDALPESHPWKHAGRFSYGGIVYEPDDSAIDEIEMDEQKMRASIAMEKLESHYVSPESGVPLRYHNESLETYQGYTKELMDVLDKVKRYAENPKNRTLILCGGNGTGKTHLACGVIRKRGGIYMTVQRLLFEVEGTMSFKAVETKVQLLDRIGNSPMLVLDEIGRGEQSEKQKELVQYLLDLRYASLLPFVLVSNLEKAALIKWLGQSIKDRLNETCIFLEVKGESYRLRKRKSA